MISLIDGDIVAYRCSAACESEPLNQAIRTMEGFLYDMLMDLSDHVTELTDNRIYLTGKGNFRYLVCADYKAQRKDKPKPKHLDALRQHLIENFDASVSDGQEADDDIAIAATELSHNVICSTDKDFLQVSTNHYNFVKKSFRWQSPFEADLFFWTQMLTGDRVDNVKGIHGIGPVKAEKLLQDCVDAKAMRQTVQAIYNDDGRFLKNGKLLWLRRYPNEEWS